LIPFLYVDLEVHNEAIFFILGGKNVHKNGISFNNGRASHFKPLEIFLKFLSSEEFRPRQFRKGLDNCPENI
jgi:hypothetical protein